MTWEEIFKKWANGPGQTERDRCDNAIRAIKDALTASEKLQDRGVRVFLQGSYRNRVNACQESDVDVGIVCESVFFSHYPEGTGDETFGNISSDYKFSQFKNEVEEALVAKFGRLAVTKGNKAFDIKANSYRVESDVAPFFEHRRYSSDKSYLSGVELIPDDGGKVINWPEQHYENGVKKNKDSNRRYKRLVRILKKLCNEMSDRGIAEAQGIPGFLCECLVWNVPNDHFGNQTFSADLRAVLIYLYEKLGSTESDEWGEVSELKYLFKGRQKWTKSQAISFVEAAWNYVGFE